MKSIFSLLSKKTALGLSTAILALGFITPSVKAATFNFGDCSTACGNAKSFNFTDDGVGVSVTGFIKGDPSQSRKVSKRATGLGVLGNNFGSGQVDSGFFKKPETLRLTFDHVVEALTAEFRLVNEPLFPGKDSVKVIFDGVNTIFEGPITPTSGQFFPGIVNFTAGNTGSILDFTLTDGNDGFRLYSLEVDKVDVPEPTAVIGLLTLGAIGLATKKKRIQKAS